MESDSADSDEGEMEMESDSADPDKSGLFWGAILKSPIGNVPDDLYMETDIISTDEYKPFTKKLTVKW
jgi:hypothetical protein